MAYKIAKKDLKNIEIEVNETGFTVWVKEKKKIKGKMKTFQHWIIDGSCIKDDGVIRLGNQNQWKINAKFSENNQALYVTRD